MAGASATADAVAFACVNAMPDVIDKTLRRAEQNEATDSNATANTMAIGNYGCKCDGHHGAPGPCVPLISHVPDLRCWYRCRLG